MKNTAVAHRERARQSHVVRQSKNARACAEKMEFGTFLADTESRGFAKFFEFRERLVEPDAMLRRRHGCRGWMGGRCRRVMGCDYVERDG